MEDRAELIAILFNLTSKQTLFKMIRAGFNNDPKDENVIKLCDEEIEKLEKQIDDVVNRLRDKKGI